MVLLGGDGLLKSLSFLIQVVIVIQTKMRRAKAMMFLSESSVLDNGLNALYVCTVFIGNGLYDLFIFTVSKWGSLSLDVNSSRFSLWFDRKYLYHGSSTSNDKYSQILKYNTNYLSKRRESLENKDSRCEFLVLDSKYKASGILNLNAQHWRREDTEDTKQYTAKFNEGYISQTLVSCNDSIPTTYLTTM